MPRAVIGNDLLSDARVPSSANDLARAAEPTATAICPWLRQSLTNRLIMVDPSAKPQARIQRITHFA
jgi:hypothetical protein